MWMGGQLQALAKVPPAAAVALITAFIACFTEFASNTATIIIFLPVIAELVSDCLIAQDLQQLASSLQCTSELEVKVTTMILIYSSLQSCL